MQRYQQGGGQEVAEVQQSPVCRQKDIQVKFKFLLVIQVKIVLYSRAKLNLEKSWMNKAHPRERIIVLKIQTIKSCLSPKGIQVKSQVSTGHTS